MAVLSFLNKLKSQKIIHNFCVYIGGMPSVFINIRYKKMDSLYRNNKYIILYFIVIKRFYIISKLISCRISRNEAVASKLHCDSLEGEYIQ